MCPRWIPRTEPTALAAGVVTAFLVACGQSSPPGAPVPAGPAEALQTDGAEVSIVALAPVEREITRTPVRLQDGEARELVEIAYYERADLADTLALDLGGNAWFVSSWSDREVRVDPERFEITEYQLPRGCGPRSLSIDGRGVHWLICLLADALLEIRPEEGYGIVHKLPISGFMTWVLADRERDLVWVSKPAQNLILQFAPGEGFTPYPIPTFDGGPGQPDLDSRGNPWFPLLYGNKLVRFDRQRKEFSEYRFPTDGALPVVTMVHSSGDVWTSEHLQDRIIVFELPDHFQEIDLPTHQSGVNALDEAPDGTVWFAQGGWRGSMGGNRIGRYHPGTGLVEEISLPTEHSQPVGLEIDAQGRVWFLEMGTGKIGLIHPLTPQPPG